MSKKKLPDNQIAVYQTPDGSINIEVLYANENIWLSQKRMAELFGCSPDNISLHLKNIYQEKELAPETTAEDFSVVQKEGARVELHLEGLDHAAGLAPAEAGTSLLSTLRTMAVEAGQGADSGVTVH